MKWIMRLGGEGGGLVWNSGIPYSINKGGREIEIVQQEESIETEEWREVFCLEKEAQSKTRTPVMKNL